MGALPPVQLVNHHRLVHQRGVHRQVKNAVLNADGINGVAVAIYYREFHLKGMSFAAYLSVSAYGRRRGAVAAVRRVLGYRALRPVLRMVIGLLGAPGMPPFTISRLRSASTRTTSSPLLVTRWLPICPAIFSPLKTLPGVVPPPMEPGARERVGLPVRARPPAEAVPFHRPGEAPALWNAR